ncbi:hypothetical protein EBT16_06705 [bacterium]|nr:hypothetical protein [bacterium]
MKCVRCQQQLSRGVYEGVDIDKCVSCGGIWLDDGELAKIVGATIETFSQSLITKTLDTVSKGIPQSEKDSVERCPKCSQEMKALNYAYQSGVIIDSCPNGHGIWVDSGEIEKVQIFKESQDRDLEKNREDWHKLAKNAKQAAESDLKSTGLLSTLIDFLEKLQS